MRKSVVLILAVVSVLLALLIAERKGDEWEETVRSLFYKTAYHSLPPASGIIMADTLGIPYVCYAANGSVASQQRYNPTIVAMYAIAYDTLITRRNDMEARRKFFHCTEWLIDHMTHRAGYALYVYDWQQPFYPEVSVPWCSGLASGRAIEALSMAYEISHERRYLDQARLLVNGFYVPVRDGGFMYTDSAGCWYEEYADTAAHTPRVLNGHIYALLGLHRYLLLTRDDSAATAYDCGLAALVQELPTYDIGDSWSYYDAWKKKADKKYQRNITELLDEMGRISGDRVFHPYAEKWRRPLDEPYLIRVIKERNRSGAILIAVLAVMSFVLLMAASYSLRVARGES